jgi:hypothetical protein
MYAMTIKKQMTYTYCYCIQIMHTNSQEKKDKPLNYFSTAFQLHPHISTRFAFPAYNPSRELLFPKNPQIFIHSSIENSKKQCCFMYYFFFAFQTCSQYVLNHQTKHYFLKLSYCMLANSNCLIQLSKANCHLFLLLCLCSTAQSFSYNLRKTKICKKEQRRLAISSAM